MRNILLLAFLFFFTITVNAQDDNYFVEDADLLNRYKNTEQNIQKRKFKLYAGVKPGINWTEVVSDLGKSIDLGQKRSGNFIAFFNADFDIPLSLQLELGYINKKSGLDFKLSSTSGIEDTLVKNVFDIHYFTIPLLLKYTFNFSDKNFPELYLTMGVETNYLIDAKLRQRVPSIDPELEFVYNRKNKTHKSEMAFLGGIGVNIPIVSNKVFLLSEYRIGFGNSNFNKGIAPISTSNNNHYPLMYQVYSQINAGIYFRVY